MDPLQHFLDTQRYNPIKVSRFLAGEKYAVAQLNDGYFGVCGHTVSSFKLNPPKEIDLNNLHHRIFYVCYLNALLNKKYQDLPPSSFVEHITANQFNTIVMIGLFTPLLKRYHQLNIYPKVFDHTKDEAILTPMTEQNYWLKKADLVILSATTLANNTFKEIISNINVHAKVVITGPSSIIHPDFSRFFPNIVISGMTFEPHNTYLIDLIEAGYGTQHFKILGKKVDLIVN